jgi:PPM family protein phosphatase
VSQDAVTPSAEAVTPDAEVGLTAPSALEQIVLGDDPSSDAKPLKPTRAPAQTALEASSAAVIPPAQDKAALELQTEAMLALSDPYATMELEDGVYIPEDELEPPESAFAPPVLLEDDPPILKSTGVEDEPPEVNSPLPSLEPALADEMFLEEVLTAPVLSATDTVTLERGQYRVTGFDAVGRKLGIAPDGTEVVIASYQSGAALTRSLYPHPMLPPLLDAATDDTRTLIAHPRLEGRTLEEALSNHDRAGAMAAILDLARFNRYLTARGFALVGLEPREVLLQPTRLSRLPSVRRIGDTSEAEAPRYGAPERASGLPVLGIEGVYSLGAMLYHALTGRALSEGELPSAFPELPGAPQALTAMLAPTSQRANPQEALDLLSKLGAAFEPRRRWLVASSSTVGISPDRATNEDSCGALQRRVFGAAGHDNLMVACVADGMGGMARGEDASQAAVRGFLDFETVELSRAVAASAAQAANARVIEALEGKSGGCTFTGVICDAERVVLAHVGDTRAYLVSDRLVQQLTEDHSMVMMLVKMGVIPIEAAHNHPDSNKVMRALGSNRVMPPDYVDTLEVTVRPNDRIVIMSDGVWGALQPSDLEAMLLEPQPVQDMADALVRSALTAGSTDNATALVLLFEEREAL